MTQTKKTFSKKSHFKVPVDELFKWHARDGALERLVPPWDPLTVLQRTGGIENGAMAVLKMNAGPVPFKWIAKHCDYIENKMFRDVQIKGPFTSWAHTHLFEPDPKNPQNASFLEDRIEYELPGAPFGPVLMERTVRTKLNRIFAYRHQTLQRDLALHLSKGPKRFKNILISGASGVVGSALIPFLTTGGHRVFRLVRRPARPESNEIYWDPQKDIIDLDNVPPIDAVIHLAGENIGQGWWTETKKKQIVESRTKGTSLIAKQVSKLSPLPKVLICASAIGYYGHREDQLLSEDAECGLDFISNVCYQWENAAAPAMDKGIRVVFLRIGVALTPAGGALQRLLPTFKLGMGAKIATGKQFISWVGIDDVLYAAYHALFNPYLYGPVNVVSPHAVTNQTLTDTLAKILNRPAIMKIPEFVIPLVFGQMGREILLSSTRVMPNKLLDSGYQFAYPDLEPALAHLLGR